jgi:hypothetical protein
MIKKKEKAEKSSLCLAYTSLYPTRYLQSLQLINAVEVAGSNDAVSANVAKRGINWLEVQEYVSKTCNS